MSGGLRVVLFGSGSPMSRAALERLDGVRGVVIPRQGWLNRRAADLTRDAKRRDIPVFEWPPHEAALRALVPDLFVVATFPAILPKTLLAISRLGALNVHPSLLPRHRGPDPLYWTYVQDDREAGVTVHWIGERVDAGDIVRSVAVPLDRGRSVDDLYGELSQAGARLLAESVASVGAGTAPRTPQDDAAATYDARPSAPLDFAIISAERVWHILRGLGGGRHDLLPVAHDRAIDFMSGAHAKAGTIERRSSTYRVHCADGYVDVKPASARVRLRAILSRIRSATQSQSR